MMFEVRDLRLVEAISRRGTMTRAATDLNVSQSALSHQLAELERAAGSPLFRRTAKGMLLTPQGERLLAAANVVLDELREAERALKGGAAGSGVIRISTECYTCYHWLPASLTTFEQRFPRVDVQVVVEATRAPLEALREGRIDLAIVTAAKGVTRVEVRPLFRDEIIVLMSSRNLLATRPYIRPTDFAGEHLLTYSLEESKLALFKDVLTPAGVRPARVSRLELTEAIVEMVKANRGISALARWAVAPYLDSPLLKGVRLTKQGWHRDWYGVVTASKKRPKYVDAFLDVLAAHGPPDFG
jgi:LysR family transcriptional regulator, regulator for metE and metH